MNSKATISIMVMAVSAFALIAMPIVLEKQIMHLQGIVLNMVVKALTATTLKVHITTAIKELKTALTQKNTATIKK